MTKLYIFIILCLISCKEKVLIYPDYNSSPQMVVKTISEASKTKNLSVLKNLCGPKYLYDDYNSGLLSLCNLEDADWHTKEEFTDSQFSILMNKEPIIIGDIAKIEVKIINKSQTDIQIYFLKNLSDKWYLYHNEDSMKRAFPDY